MLCFGLLHGSGCTAEDGATAPAPTVTSASQVDAKALEVTKLLEHLAVDHESFRTALGRHRVEYTLHVEATPTQPAPELPPLGSAVPQPWAVTDELALVWDAAPNEPPSFRLEQHNDHDRGLETMLVDGSIYTRERFRSWTQQPVETDATTRRLDEVVRSVHDIVSFAAPALAIEVRKHEGGGLGGGSSVEVKLATAAEADPERRATGAGREWRADADLQKISGTIVLDQASGIWLSADVAVRYALMGPDGTPTVAVSELTARAEPLAEGEARLKAPEGADPVFDRTRYTDERRRLLDGLAAP